MALIAVIAAALHPRCLLLLFMGPWRLKCSGMYLKLPSSQKFKYDFCYIYAISTLSIINGAFRSFIYIGHDHWVVCTVSFHLFFMYSFCCKPQCLICLYFPHFIIHLAHWSWCLCEAQVNPVLTSWPYSSVVVLFEANVLVSTVLLSPSMT